MWPRSHSLQALELGIVPRSTGLFPIPSQPDRHPDHTPGFLVLGPAASASPESLLETHILSFISHLLNQHLHFNNILADVYTYSLQNIFKVG